MWHWFIKKTYVYSVQYFLSRLDREYISLEKFNLKLQKINISNKQMSNFTQDLSPT